MWSTQQTLSSITLLHNRAFRSFESGANSLSSTELQNRMLSCLQRLIQGTVLFYVPTCLCLASGGAWWCCFDRNSWKSMSMTTSCWRESHCLFQLYDHIRVNEWYKHGNFFTCINLPFVCLAKTLKGEAWNAHYGWFCSMILITKHSNWLGHSERMIQILLDKSLIQVSQLLLNQWSIHSTKWCTRVFFFPL